MRRLTALIFLVSGCLQAQPASVAGAVVDQAGKPLPNVHIRLVLNDYDRESDGVPKAVYGVNSDSGGRFSVGDLPAGLYTVTADRAGYLQKSNRAVPTLVIKASESVSDFQIVMLRRAILAGKVVDEFGDPVQYVNIRNEPAERDHAVQIYQPYVMTDDRGEFRMVVAPGKYYLRAESQRAFMMRGEEIRTDGTPSGPFATTYYPSVPNSAAASPIEVAPGQDVTGLEIHLLRGGPNSPARTFTISGTVTGVPENSTAMVTLQWSDTPGQTNLGGFTLSAPNGQFSVQGQRAGFYSVTARVSSGKTYLQSRAAEFHLESTDQTGLVLTLVPGEELQGKLQITGAAKADAPAKYTVQLGPLNGDSFGTPTGEAAVNADGSFRIPAVPLSKFHVVVDPMPENGYLKEVAIDGKSVPDRVLDFTQGIGGSRVSITVSRNAAQISGIVKGSDGQPVIGLTRVYLMSDPKHMEDGGMERTANGKFTFEAVRPGKYHIIAIDSGELMQSFNYDGGRQNIMERLFDAGEEISVQEGDRVSKEIPLLTKIPEKEAH